MVISAREQFILIQALKTGAVVAIADQARCVWLERSRGRMDAPVDEFHQWLIYPDHLAAAVAAQLVAHPGLP